MTDAQRKAVFFKLEHTGPLDLGSTDLKFIAKPTDDTSLVISKSGNLSKLEKKLSDFITTGRSVTETSLKSARWDSTAAGLTDIKKGEPKDRLSPSFLQNYETMVTSDHLIYEIEVFTPVDGSSKRKNSLLKIFQDIETILGRGVYGRIYETDYAGPTARAVLWSSGEAFKKLVEDEKFQVSITTFEPRPEFETFHTTYEGFNVAALGPLLPPADDAPIICIIDSGVSPDNPFLSPVVKRDLVKSYVPNMTDNPYDEDGHGSGVASLAAYHALGIAPGTTNRAKAWIASARIMNAEGHLESINTNNDEEFYAHNARLLSNVLKDIVNDFKPHGVRIFVLAYNIINRIWNVEGRAATPKNSWVCRTIDQIAREQDVIFVTITGNLDAGLVFDAHSQNKYPAYLTEDSCRIQDPAQSALSVTVGSVAHSSKVVGGNGGVTLADSNQPSPFTRTGPGINRAIKPDFVERGGNSVLDSSGQVRPNLGTNVLMASNKISPPLQHACGTSFAAPRVAGHLASILHELTAADLNPSACLVKAFLANSSSWPDACDEIKTALPSKQWLNVIGLGLPNGENATNCDGASAILYYDGKIKADQVALFKIPVPAELSGTSSTKRLKISISFAPPVQRWGLEEYLGITVKFRVFTGATDPDDIIEAMTLAANEANVAATLPSGELDYMIGINPRSKGAIQHDICEWNQHKPEWSTHDYTLAVATSKASWGSRETEIPIAIVVRLDETSHSVNTVHSHARTRTQIRA